MAAKWSENLNYIFTINLVRHWLTRAIPKRPLGLTSERKAIQQIGLHLEIAVKQTILTFCGKVKLVPLN